VVDTIRIKRRAVGGAAGAPASLAASELAYNEQDDTLYYGKGNSSGAATSVVPIAGSGAFQPKDADLTSLAAASATNAIYYRLAPDTWGPVSIGTGLTFAAGTLAATATGGGGGIAYTFSSTAPATPNAGDLWYDSTTGGLAIRVNDGTSSQWIQVAPTGYLDGPVRYDTVQTLAPAQQTQARVNAYAAPFDALAYSGIQVNGGMDVSQQNGGTLISSVSATGNADCFWTSKSGTGALIASGQNVGDAPPGYNNSIKVTVTTAQASFGATDWMIIYTPIEGYRMTRLGFGTANAQPISIGFWTKAHRTGTYSASIRGRTPVSYSYPFTFTQNVADAWEFKTVTVPGCTTGTWEKGTNPALDLIVVIACGSTYLGTANVWQAANLYGVTGTTNGVAATTDTFQLAGVIILPGIELPSATRAPFVMRHTSDELLLCKRYFYNGVPPAMGYTSAGAASCSRMKCPHPVTMRIAPTATVISPIPIYDGAGTAIITSIIAGAFSTTTVLEFEGNTNTTFPDAHSIATYQGAGGNLEVDARM
jgi:hypothetical protein